MISRPIKPTNKSRIIMRGIENIDGEQISYQIKTIGNRSEPYFVIVSGIVDYITEDPEIYGLQTIKRIEDNDKKEKIKETLEKKLNLPVNFF